MTSTHTTAWSKTLPLISLSLLSVTATLPAAHAEEAPTDKEAEIIQQIKDAQPGEKIELTDSLIVTLDENYSKDEVIATVNDALSEETPSVEDVTKESLAGDESTVVVELTEAMDEQQQQEIITTLEQSPAVEAVEPDFIVKAIASTSEPSYGRQWALHPNYLNVPAAWARGLNGSGKTLGIVDTGYTWHPDLSTPVAQYDFVSNPATARDGDGRDGSAVDVGTGNTMTDSHGLHVQGIAAARANGTGIVGVAPRADVVHARALGLYGAGQASDIIDGAYWTIGGSVAGVPNNPRPATVLNLSLGWPGSCSLAMQNMLNEAERRGVMTIVAAGNASRPAINYTPANCRNVLAVGATTSWGALAAYSNYGSAVDVVAPGGTTGAGIYSTLNTGSWSVGQPTYGDKNGTSMATPYVAGTALLMQQANPNMTPAEGREIILSTSKNVAGYKQVNTDAATAEAKRRATPQYRLAPGSGIEAAYYQYGGANAFGSPTSNEFGLVDGGVAQNFSKNSTIYWTSNYGAYPVNFNYSIGQKYKAGGYENRYGYPVTKETSLPGGAFQRFKTVKGSQTTLYWSPVTQRTHAVYDNGGIGVRFNQLGGTTRLGFPSEDEVPIHNGTRQTFVTSTTETRIYWSPLTGAHPVNAKGAIFHKWVNQNGLNTLGFPATSEVSVPGGGVMQRFVARDGSRTTGIWWSQSTGAHSLNINGAIAQHWIKNGYTNTFGYPLNSEVAARDGSVTVKFSKGKTITWKNGSLTVR